MSMNLIRIQCCSLVLAPSTSNIHHLSAKREMCWNFRNVVRMIKIAINNIKSNSDEFFMSEGDL